ncbi:unnamed protein product [Paramecium sonneborni]|uniref:Uncharacterized protein n=1 Tax=Paramecium sonneborni TaxID=65129 RepID=A0A8S1PZK3_9CILI|nr:unnamed protein product [Paramecium sonneborni]
MIKLVVSMNLKFIEDTRVVKIYYKLMANLKKILFIVN